MAPIPPGCPNEQAERSPGQCDRALSQLPRPAYMLRPGSSRRKQALVLVGALSGAVVLVGGIALAAVTHLL